MEAFFAQIAESVEEYDSVSVSAAAAVEGDLVLSLEIYSSGSSSSWRITAQGPREYRLHLGPCAPSLVKSHPLLWPHQGPQGSLYFSSRPADAPALIGRLWSRHQRETQRWLDFSQMLNQTMPLHDVLEGGFGLIANGPEPLLRAYGEELEHEGVKWNIANVRPASSLVTDPGYPFWRRNAREEPLEVLLLGGRDFLIAAKFVAVRQS